MGEADKCALLSCQGAKIVKKNCSAIDLWKKVKKKFVGLKIHHLFHHSVFHHDDVQPLLL